MYQYRLTRRGKIVLTSFIIILLSVTGALSNGMTARALNYLSDKPVTARDFEANGLGYTDLRGEKSGKVYSDSSEDVKIQDSEKSKELSSTFKVMSANYFSKDNSEEGVLKVEAEKAYANEGRKVAFLTFDDGPSKNITPQVLDILDKYGVKATFFIVGSVAKSNSVILKDIANRGHAIGIHTYTHNYKLVYKSPESFTNEIIMTEAVLKENFGQEFNTRLFRMPGGSFEGYKKQYRDILENRGYVSVDWNAITGDGESSDLPPQKLLDRLKSTSEGKQNLVLLMHDSPRKQTTADALPGIIEYLKSQGYEFGVLN